MASVTEGFVAFRGYRTWWRRYAPPDDAEGRVPLIAVHGGPGMPSVLDDSALELAGHLGRPVVFYHQVGCGRSDRPDDPSLWSVEFFVDELANLRRELSLDDVHISSFSLVTRSIAKPGQYTGVFPLDDNASWEKNAATLRQLYSMRERLRALEKKMS